MIDLQSIKKYPPIPSPPPSSLTIILIYLPYPLYFIHLPSPSQQLPPSKTFLSPFISNYDLFSTIGARFHRHFLYVTTILIMISEFILNRPPFFRPSTTKPTRTHNDFVITYNNLRVFIFIVAIIKSSTSSHATTFAYLFLLSQPSKVVDNNKLLFELFKNQIVTKHQLFIYYLNIYYNYQSYPHPFELSSQPTQF